MYLVPQPKKISVKKEKLNCFQYNLVLDAKCESRIFKASQELKKVMEENGFTGIKILKPLTVPKKCIYLTFDGEDESKQGYSIKVNQKGIVIKGESQRGLFYGIQTFKQIVEQEKVMIPFMEIKDQPDLYERGYFFDITRGRVATVDGIKRIIDKLVLYKYTDLHLYIENAFNWQGFEEINVCLGFLTAEEIMELDEYCYDRYIDLVPCFATLGHLYHLLQTESFKKYCELKDYEPKGTYWQQIGPHHSIDLSNPESIELIKKMLDQVIPLFRSKKFNINCDESVDIGEGRSKKLADKIGKGQMYVDHINKLYKYLHDEHGKEVMFWSDIVGNYFPDLLGDCSYVIPQLPKDITCLFWNYRVPYREDRLKTIMDTHLKNNIVFCPWDATTSRFIPRYHSNVEGASPAYENIIEMAHMATKFKTGRFLLTNWGHSMLAELITPMLILGGAKSWNSEGNIDVEEFDKYVSKAEYGDEKVLSVLKKISKISAKFNWQHLKGELAGVLSNIEVNEAKKIKVQPPKKSLYNDYMKFIQLEAELASCNINDTRDAVMACVEASRFVIAIKLAQKYPVKDNFELANEIENWYEEYSKAWRKYNKEGDLRRIIEFFEHYCKVLRTGNWELEHKIR